MSATEARAMSRDPSVGRVDMKFEVQVIPVSDVDRSKRYYLQAGWRLDEDVAPIDGLRIVQFTPPGSGTSVDFGQGLTTAAPGAAQGALTVSDIEAAREELVSRGIEVSDIWHGPPFPVQARQPGIDPERASYGFFFCLQRPRRQPVAGPGGHDPAPRPDQRHRDGLRIHADLEGALRRAEAAHREHEKRTGRSHLFHRSDQDENWLAWYATYMVAEQAGTALPS